MPRRDAVTPQQVRDLIIYDPETGAFTWRTSRQGVNAGDEAGCFRSDGYRLIGMNWHVHLAHRIAWLYMTGEWPTHGIDHINGDPSDNRWANLRPATQSQNLANASKRRSNTSGFRGVSRSFKGNSWIARISFNKKTEHLGSFKTKEEAHAAYIGAAERLFGAYKRQEQTSVILTEEQCSS